MQNSHRKLAVSATILFTLSQFIILYLFGYTPYPDSNGYISLALECVKSDEPYPVSSQISYLPFIWNIGAINIIALSLKLFGSILPLLLLYSMLKGFSAWLVYLISNILFREKTAILALILYVIYPANYGESTSVLSELPFTFFIMLGIYSSLKHENIIGGMLMAFANWIRPMGLVFLLSIMIYYLITKKKHALVKTACGYFFVIVIISTMSYIRTGYCIYQAKTGWMSLLQYSVDNSPEDDAHYTQAKGYNAIQKDSVWQKQTIKWIKKYPKEYIRQIPNKLVKTYISDNINFCTFLPNKNESSYMYKEISMPTLACCFPHFTAVQWLTLYNLFYYYLLIVLFAAAIIKQIANKQLTAIAIPLGNVTIGTLILLLVGHGEARFHIPLMPFIIMVAANFASNNPIVRCFYNISLLLSILFVNLKRKIIRL